VAFLVFLPSAVVICFAYLCFCILSTWSFHLSRRDFINFTVSSVCNMTFLSLFALILQPSLSFMGPCIFRKVILWNILSSLVSSMVVPAVSDTWVTMHHIRVLNRVSV
jgi:hypothetical protein